MARCEDRSDRDAAPRVSVVMPAYNAARFVGDAVRSVLGQTLRELELIVVDDGSRDGTAEAAAAAAAGDARVRILRRSRAGVADARNAGFALARAPLVAHLDADDLALPQRLAKQAAFLAAHPEVVAAGTRCRIVDDEGDPYEEWGVDTEHEKIEAKLLQGIGGALPNTSAMFRRAAVIGAGGFRPELPMCEDLDLLLRLAERGRLANVPETLTLVRRYPGSTSDRASREEHMGLRRQVVGEALRRRGLPERPVWAPPHDACGKQGDEEKARALRAWEHGFLRTARKYAWRAVRTAPLRSRLWRLAFAASAAAAFRPRADGRRAQPAREARAAFRPPARAA